MPVIATSFNSAKFLRKNLRMYKVHLSQGLQPNDKPSRKKVTVNKMEQISGSEIFPIWVCFKKTEQVQCENPEIRTPYVAKELYENSPMVNVWGRSHVESNHNSFFSEIKIRANVYHDLLTEYVSHNKMTFNQPVFLSTLVNN